VDLAQHGARLAGRFIGVDGMELEQARSTDLHLQQRRAAGQRPLCRQHQSGGLAAGGALQHHAFAGRR